MLRPRKSEVTDPLLVHEVVHLPTAILAVEAVSVEEGVEDADEVGYRVGLPQNKNKKRGKKSKED